jgi:hypothetical protein
MAARILASGGRPANILHRQWQKRLIILERASVAVIEGADGDVEHLGGLLSEAYGRMCELTMTPAPDLAAFRVKLECCHDWVFAHEPALNTLSAALVADAQRLI